MRTWWALLVAANLIVLGACAPTGGGDDDDDDDNTPIDTIQFPGACVLGNGYDGATLPAGFPLSTVGVNLGDTLADYGSCLQNSAGTEYHLYAYLGNVQMLSFGTGWCPPCQSEAADIQQLFTDFHSDGFVVQMGMFEDYNGNSASPAFLDTWQSTYGITFPMLADNSGEMADYYQPADQGYIPLNVVLDRDGRVIYNSIGAINVNQVRNIIIGALNNPAELEYDYPPTE